jgi:mRNA interferase MazF
MKPIKRGDLYYTRLNPVVGSEQGDNRPCVIVQNDIGNKHSPTIIIVPLTCQLNKASLPTHVFIPRGCGLETDSFVLAEQIRTVDRSRLGRYIGRISDRLMDEVDAALAVGIGIEGRRSPKGELFILTLCSRCERDFVESGYVVVRKGWQKIKEDCDFCNTRKGITFGVFSPHKTDNRLDTFFRNRASTENQT